MSEQTVRLTYPEHLVEVPIIQQLIRRYELTVNIIRAEISGQTGWLEVRLSGEQAEMERALAWLEGLGLQVETANQSKSD